MKLSIIIVNYNVTQLLKNCLLSITTHTRNLNYEIIVIDNNSPDQSWKNLMQEFPTVVFIENKHNEGFSKANNKAILHAKGEYLLLLNPDTEFESDLMAELITFADNQPKFGCLGVRMHDGNGQFLPESKRSVPNVLNSFEKLFTNFKQNKTKSYYREDINQYDIASVEIITGAFLLCKKEVYQKIGGLDETYFMYGEDIDLCYTFLLHGFNNYYYGKHSILHLKGESTVKNKEYLDRFYGAMQIFVNKYHKKNIFKYALLTLGLKLKYQLERSKLLMKKFRTIIKTKKI